VVIFILLMTDTLSEMWSAAMFKQK